jgi:opacity protein-like surface antigen
MKKIIITTVLLGLLAIGLQAINLDVGLMYGSRSVKDPTIREVYGNGSVYFPYLAVNFWRGLALGLGYEGGYDRDGRIGLYQEPTTLKVAGMEFFTAYIFTVKKFSPYFKLGLASFSYEQSVNGEVKFDKKKSALTLAGGARFYPVKSLFLAAEIKYVPLKVKPLTEEVDLSGMRFAVGIGYTFAL